ncbi:hypothetical protein AA15237_0242 [Komagataeibacter xylinus NBRC 15237]|nr:hypothetical protein AA15237_0242 [Komagataeibacter xylinus NBRC 15237]
MARKQVESALGKYITEAYAYNTDESKCKIYVITNGQKNAFVCNGISHVTLHADGENMNKLSVNNDDGFYIIDMKKFQTTDTDGGATVYHINQVNIYVKASDKSTNANLNGVCALWNSGKIFCQINLPNSGGIVIDNDPTNIIKIK